MHLNPAAQLALMLAESGTEGSAAETYAGCLNLCHALLQFSGIQPGGSNQLKGLRGAAAFRNVRTLKDTGACIAQGGLQVRTVGGGCNPGEVCVIQTHRSGPALKRDHRKRQGKPKIIPDIAGKLANGQGVLGGKLIIAYEGGKTGIQTGPAMAQTSEGIDPVQNHHCLACAVTGLHCVSKGIKIGIKARTDILHIKYQHIKGIKHRFCKMTG